MLDFEPFLAELRTQIKTVWPEVTAVWDAEHLSMVPWDRLTLPYAVILIDEWPEADNGAANQCYQPAAAIYYVAETTGKAVSLRAKLKALSAHFWPTDPLSGENGQTWEVGRISYSDSLPVNQMFRDANRHQRAGKIEITFLLGETNG